MHDPEYPPPPPCRSVAHWPLFMKRFLRLAPLSLKSFLLPTPRPAPLLPPIWSPLPAPSGRAYILPATVALLAPLSLKKLLTPNPTSSPATAPTLEPTPSPFGESIHPAGHGSTPSPTATGSLALGCYEDDREDRIMGDLALSDYSMTTELCELTCLGSTYFATQYGRECWCGSADVDYALHGESTDCTYACAGDADQTCGGFDAANVYQYADGNAPTSSFVGCYQDESDARIMELALTDSSSMTTEMCETECTGNTYFGMQYGRECFCGGSSTDLLEHGESSACNYECPGDSDQVCGGFYAMSVYSYS
ncbi:unnamed protein product [Ectocarpus sp. 4 AP-2014]